jgi:hypothetical protein
MPAENCSPTRVPILPMDGYAGNYRQGDDTMKNDKTHHDLSRREFLRWKGAALKRQVLQCYNDGGG